MTLVYYSVHYIGHMDKINLVEYNYVVIGPGRTGSLLIMHALGALVEHDRVIHTHNPINLRLPLVNDRDRWILVRSYRKSEFDGAISQIISSRTNEYSHYSNKHFVPEYVDLNNFDAIIIGRRNVYKEIDVRNYAYAIDIYLEDMLQYPYYLFEQFGQIDQEFIKKTDQSPRHGKELISNYDEISQHWTEKYCS